MVEVTSRDNPKIKLIRRIRDGREPDSIFLEGLRLCREAMRSPVEITDAVFAKSFSGFDEFESIPDRIVVPDKVFQTLSDTKQSQGVIFIARRPATDFAHFMFGRSAVGSSSALLMHRINNPQNLGAIMRSCEAAGVRDVVVSNGSADCYSAKSLRASMGSALRMNVWERAGFDEILGWAKRSGLKLVATDISGSRSYRDFDWSVPHLIVFGSEAHGLCANELEAMDEVVTIPMKNGVESLNLAVAAGIILFERIA